MHVPFLGASSFSHIVSVLEQAGKGAGGSPSSMKYKTGVFCFVARLKQNQQSFENYPFPWVLCFAQPSPRAMGICCAPCDDQEPTSIPWCSEPGAQQHQPLGEGKGGCSGAAEPLQLPPPACHLRRATDSPLLAKAKSPLPGPPAP